MARNIAGRKNVRILIRSHCPLFFSSSHNHKSLGRFSARCSSFTSSSLTIRRSSFTCSSLAAHDFINSPATWSPACPVTMALQECDRFPDFKACKTAMQDWGRRLQRPGEGHALCIEGFLVVSRFDAHQDSPFFHTTACPAAPSSSHDLS